MSTPSGPGAVPSQPAPALAPLYAQVPPGSPWAWLPEGAWQPPPEPAPTVQDRVPAAALIVFWMGVLVTGALRAVPDPFDYEAHLSWLYVIDVVYLAVMAVVGVLARRRGLPVLAVLAWLAGGALLIASIEGWNRVAETTGWPYTTINHLAYANLAIILTLLAAAYLAVRRSAPVGYAALPVVLVVAVGWFELFAEVYTVLPGATLTYRLMSALFLTVATALMAGVLALAGRIGHGRAARPASMPGYPGATGYAPAPGPGGRPAPYGPQSTNTLAVVALVLGLVGVSLGGVICGHLALGQIRRTGERGSGMAIAGLVLGYVGLVLTAVVVVFLVAVASSMPSY